MKWLSKYTKRMIVGFIAYALGIIAVVYCFPEHSHKHWLVLFPIVIALIYFAITVIRSLSDMDEMWRRNATEAMAFSAVATGFTCFGYQFFHDIIGAPQFHADWAFYMMWVYYGIGTFISWWRYK
jgi:uncharacterized membrane protein HdeD (DUF308 family)